jgi:transaldolase / glucose-6-phosphate isomerase
MGNRSSVVGVQPFVVKTGVNPLRELAKAGQSVWLDYIRRSFVTGGELAGLVEGDGLAGVTSNPSIFEKAVTGSTDYADALAALGRRSGIDAAQAYERLVVEDVQLAADVLRPVWDSTAGRDGYASLEVSPRLAHDTQATVSEARRLWRELARPNVMVKVPATAAGLPAIEALTAEGINVNVTLLFSVNVYAEVAEAFLRGLERLAEGAGDLARIASVASFFVSRIDTDVDAQISKRLAERSGDDDRVRLERLLGKVAIANAKIAYQRYLGFFAGPRWDRLQSRGARPQRLLWASTSTKNPAYRDVMYAEELVGPDTVDTMPPATLAAFREHGRVRPSLLEDPDGATRVLAELGEAGISLEDVTGRLTDQGVRLFSEAFDKLLAAVGTALSTHAPARAHPGATLPEPEASAVRGALAAWASSGGTRRVWARDASVWTGGDEAQWLGWLGITDDQRAHLGHLREIADDVKAAGFTDAVLLGMGGSSLAPDVLRRTFGPGEGHPGLTVLDSTDPDQIRAVERGLDLARTLFIVSSKSGTTVEPNLLKAYFLARVRETVGEEAPRRFIAVTDPGSPLEAVAREDGFLRVFHGVPSIGGRYSALSDFGLVPAAITGVPVAQLLDRAEEMAHACASCVPDAENPGVVLGTALGALAKGGRDKVTVVASPPVAGFGAWLEQLLAESTGKRGKGLIPVDGEKLGLPEVYGSDRVFVYLRMSSAPDAEQDAALDRLARAGHPVIRLDMETPVDIGREFFRWEFATAVAGSLLGINPFDQPDVESAKETARRLTAEYESSGVLPEERPVAEGGEIALFAAGGVPGNGGGLAGVLRTYLASLAPGDYFALLAYVEMNDSHREALQAIRHRVRDARRVATCLGFGPRFQHSTGQAYKGGPNKGVFLQLTHDQAEDLPVPGRRLSFGVVEAAQARGDLAALAERGRCALRVHVGADVGRGLARLDELVAEALG